METTEQTGMLSKIERKGEVAIAAMAAKAKAEVEARYVIALQRPRNILETRNVILDSCKRPAFAHGAIYKKPVGGGKTADGFSIRFAEEAIKSMKNIAVDAMTIYEDEDRRTVRISVTDLESNTTYGDEISISKTVERRTLKEGQIAISERMNSNGIKVFLVAATDDDLLNKVNSAKSKAIRNSGLRLVPQDILEEAWDALLKTIAKGGGDPKAETKKVCDGFASLNISPSELERYLGHSLETVSPKELQDLRGIWTAIKDEETSWAAVMETAKPKKPGKTGPGADDDDDGGLGPQKEPAADPKKEAAAIDAASIDKPYEKLKELAARDGVTLEQIHAYMKSNKLAGEKTEELLQAADDKMRMVVMSWKSCLPNIKGIKIA